MIFLQELRVSQKKKKKKNPLKANRHNAEARKETKNESVSIPQHLSHGTLGSSLIISFIFENLSVLFLSKTFFKYYIIFSFWKYKRICGNDKNDKQ